MGYQKGHIPSFAKLKHTIVREARETAARRIREWAEDERQAFKDAILGQDFESFVAKPLSRRYLQRKRAKGADTRVMIATRHYIDSIKVFEERGRDGTWRWLIGFDKQEPAHDLDGNDTDIKLVEVARIHEHGAVLDESTGARIPARPHWKPHLKQMHKDAPRLRDEIREEVANLIRQRMRA